MTGFLTFVKYAGILLLAGFAAIEIVYGLASVTVAIAPGLVPSFLK